MTPNDDDASQARRYLFYRLPFLREETLAEMLFVARQCVEGDATVFENETAAQINATLPDLGPTIATAVARAIVILARAEEDRGPTH